MNKPITYINKHTGDVLESSLRLGPEWSPVTQIIDKDGKPKLRFHLNGATVVLEEVTSGNPTAI